VRSLRALAALLLLAGARASADEVVLKGGSRIEGVVLSKDEKEVVLLLPGSEELRLSAADVAKVSPDDEAPQGDTVIRYVDREEEGSSLEVALVHLVKPGAPRIDLVGAVHIADASYYHAVQALLDRADVVLFEMVKPKDARADAPEDEKAPNPIREFQKNMGRWFGLAFQLDAIDYGRANFVHADLTAEEVFAAMGDGEENPAELLQNAAGMGGAALSSRLEGDEDDEGVAERRLNMKRMFARIMGTLGSKASMLFGPKLGDIVISRRNAVVVTRLKELPPGTHDVAVFYGAAHIPDLEERIVSELGYRRAGSRWLAAWDIPAAVPELAGAR
jgi:hypothetical protein